MRHGVIDEMSGDDEVPDNGGPVEDVDRPVVHSPSRYDPVARAASALVGGPAGRRLASRVGFWGAVPVLVLLAGLSMAIGVVQKEHCRAQGWSAPDHFWHACYSDIAVVYGSADLGADDRGSLTDSLAPGGSGQSPVTGTLMWLTSGLVPADGDDAARQFFDLSAVLLTLLLCVAVAALTITARGRPWDAAHLALSPVLVTAGLVSYQLLAVALLAAALLALVRGRGLLGGVLAGLAVAAGPQVAVVVVAVAVLSFRRLRSGIGATFAGTALATWLILRILLLPGATGRLRESVEAWIDSTPSYGSSWLLPQLLAASTPDQPDSLAGRVVVGLFGWIFRLGSLSGTTSAFLALVLLAALAMAVTRYTLVEDPAPEADVDAPVRSPELEGVDERALFVTARVAPLALALTAAVLIASKSLPLQASLLLLPLIALSGLRWRDHLIWAAAEVAYFVAIWLYIAGESNASRGLPASFYLVFLFLRVAAIAWIGFQGVRAFRRPWPVAAGHDPDTSWSWAPGPADEGTISSPAGGEGRLLGDPETAAAPQGR